MLSLARTTESLVCVLKVQDSLKDAAGAEVQDREPSRTIKVGIVFSLSEREQWGGC